MKTLYDEFTWPIKLLNDAPALLVLPNDFHYSVQFNATGRKHYTSSYGMYMSDNCYNDGFFFQPYHWIGTSDFHLLPYTCFLLQCSYFTTIYFIKNNF